MEKFKEISNQIINYIKPFFKWAAFAAIMGVLGGVMGWAFHWCLEKVTGLRTDNPWLISLLPVAGIVITALYRLFKSRGTLNTNTVFDSIDRDEKVPLILAPLIFIGTIITHLFGGSAGREGAALQLGGSLGYNIGKLLKLNKSDRNIVVMSGMSAFFAAMFGAPLTAAIFALEVIRVGYVRHCGFMPCILSSVIAYEISKTLGAHGVRFQVFVPELSAEILLKVVFLAILCALVSILFCASIKQTSVLFHKFIHNSYLRSAIGAAIVVGLTAALGTTDYNGAGMDVIARAVNGEASTFAFLLKIIFTSITIAAGFKGGEIVPTLFIGATFGCVSGGLLGLDCGFAASLGFVALFCGVVNCPFASVALAAEVFGGNGILIYAIVCAVSFMMSGNFSLYKSQKIMFSKTADEQVEI